MFKKMEKIVICSILSFLFVSCAKDKKEEKRGEGITQKKEYIRYNVKNCAIKTVGAAEIDRKSTFPQLHFTKDFKYFLYFHEGNNVKTKELDVTLFSKDVLVDLEKSRDVADSELSREACVEIDKQVGSSFSYPPRNFWTDFSSEKGLEVKAKYNNLSEIPNKEKIVNLSLEDSSITSLESIESFKNLKVIFLLNSKIKDLRPLELIKDREIFVLYNPKEISVPENPIQIYVDMTDYKCSVWNYANYQFGYYLREHYKPNSPEKVFRDYRESASIYYIYEKVEFESECNLDL